MSKDDYEDYNEDYEDEEELEDLIDMNAGDLFRTATDFWNPSDDDLKDDGYGKYFHTLSFTPPNGYEASLKDVIQEEIDRSLINDIISNMLDVPSYKDLTDIRKSRAVENPYKAGQTVKIKVPPKPKPKLAKIKSVKISRPYGKSCSHEWESDGQTISNLVCKHCGEGY